jgi:hypothetical protein
MKTNTTVPEIADFERKINKLDIQIAKVEEKIRQGCEVVIAATNTMSDQSNSMVTTTGGAVDLQADLKLLRKRRITLLSRCIATLSNLIEGTDNDHS